jgi:hypothetical protein
MNLLLKLLIFAIGAVILMPVNLKSQTLASPIAPERIIYYGQLGLVFGLGQNFQSGKYYVACDDCIFEDGVKFGYTIGLNYEYKLTDMLNIGIMGLFDDYGLRNSYVENERVQVRSTDGSYNETITIPFRHTAESDFTMISFMPHIKFFPTKFLFINLGLNLGIQSSANIKHEKELLRTTAKLSNGAVVDVKIEGTDATSVVIEDNRFPLLNMPQMSLVPMVGFHFDIKDRFYLRPFFMYRIPLTNFSDRGEDFMISTWRLMFEASLKL